MPASQGTIDGGGKKSDDTAEEKASPEAGAIRTLNKWEGTHNALTKADPLDPVAIEAAEKQIITAKEALAQLQKGQKDKGIVKALDAAMASGMETSLTKKIANLDEEITRLRGHLADSNSGFERSVNTIVGVQEIPLKPATEGSSATAGSSGTEVTSSTSKGKDNDTTAAQPTMRYTMADEKETGADKNLLSGGAQPAKQPDPWTKVVFTSSTDVESKAMGDKSMNAEAKAKIGGLWCGAESSTTISESAKYVFRQFAVSLDFVLTSIIGRFAWRRLGTRSVAHCKSP